MAQLDKLKLSSGTLHNGEQAVANTYTHTIPLPSIIHPWPPHSTNKNTQCGFLGLAEYSLLHDHRFYVRVAEDYNLAHIFISSTSSPLSSHKSHAIAALIVLTDHA